MASAEAQTTDGLWADVSTWLQKNRRTVVVLVIALVLIFTYRAVSASRMENAKTQAGSGLKLYQKGKFSQATKQLEASVRLNPQNAKAQRALGQSYESTGKLEKAAMAYRDSLAVDPKQPEVLYNLAIIYKSQGKTKQAVAELGKAVSYNKQFVAARLILGDLYLQQGDKAKAKEQYQAVVEMRPFGVDVAKVGQKIKELK